LQTFARPGTYCAGHPDTATGIALLFVPPLPSWPTSFFPQQYTVSAVVIAHEYGVIPAVMALKVKPPATAFGPEASVVEPSPSWPK
jgi:hypothetical protein